MKALNDDEEGLIMASDGVPSSLPTQLVLLWPDGLAIEEEKLLPPLGTPLGKALH